MRRNLFLLGLLLLPLAASAHVNSPDVYYDGYAGPYHLLVTVRPAAVVPGVAQIQIRSAGDDVEQIRIVPMGMVSTAARFAPVPDPAVRDANDPRLFNGKLWLMDRGSWKVQIEVEGKKGKGQLSVPVPAVSSNSARMQKTLGIILAVLGLALVAGFVSIIGAAAREAELEPGETPTPAQRKRGRIQIAAAAVIAAGMVLFGNWWWGAEATANAAMNYKIPHVESSLQAGNVLHLQLENPNPPAPNRFKVAPPDSLVLTDLVPDHGHIMHLFLVSKPDMKSFWHLHPYEEDGARFVQKLPAVPAGQYWIYADIVHKTGFPETQVGEVNVPSPAASQNAAQAGAVKVDSRWSNPDDSGVADASASGSVAQLSDGYRMVWERDPAPLKANQAEWFRFRVEDKNGKPAAGMENYMGMAGHAVFISADGKIFAHVHPAGSVSMAALNIAEGAAPQQGMASMDHMPASAEVSFPYGFPKPGDYRIFVQVKRAGKVETGAFLARVN